MFSRPRILLADDHQIVVDGLSSLLAHEFELCGAVADGLALIERARLLGGDVSVRSSPGAGVSIDVRIPVVRAAHV